MPGSKQKQCDPVKKSDDREVATKTQLKFPFVGIGASAGGLAAFKAFFSAMPDDSGMAFILVPHLDPTHQSLMVEILAAKTAMPVCEAKENMTVKPDHVYIIPPGVYMTVNGGKIHLAKPTKPRGAETAIDHFLQSLALDQEAYAIAIILSGTGSHGSMGVRTVKAAGGMAIAQNPATAEYKDMPKNAIATGIIDYVLAPEKMPMVLVQYAAHIYLDGVLRPALVTESNKEDLGRVLAIIQARTKYDFRCYRKNMLMRRVQRRMGLNNIELIPDYLEFLRQDNDEVKQLFRDLLIGVTGFFRDPEAYQVLDQRIFPTFIENRDVDNPVRVWIPGCATGEEAYSIAILLIEQFSAAKKRPGLKIFATDLDEDALEFARQGIYPASIADTIPHEQLEKHFKKIDSHYQVSKELRDCVVFASQNLVSDAPFSKLDLISCRNLLIYLETEVQKKVISLFHFALNDDGYLLLGSSETIGLQTNLFETISKKWRIFHRLGPSRTKRASFPIVSGDRRHNLTQLKRKIYTRDEIDLAELTERQLLDDFAPASVLINRQHEILYFHGPTGIFLELPTGKPTSNLIAMARRDIRTKLRAVCNKAIYQNKLASDNTAAVKYDNEWHYCTICVKPILEPRQAEGLLLVTFSEHEKLTSSQIDKTEAQEAITSEESPLIRELEYELKATREDLQSTIEEMDTSNEEMKASNEEAMSMNEELQSANEELETSKEELQSLNEELNSVNSQLQDKVAELDKAHNDITNLFHSTDIAAIFLDTEMRIRQFTPSTGKLIGLLPSDIGRTISTFSTKFTGKDLLAESHQVLEKLTPTETELWIENNPQDKRSRKETADSDMLADNKLSPIASPNTHCYLRRIRPYRTEDNHIEGVVVTFMDITERKQGELENRENVRWQQMVEHFPAGAIYIENNQITVNRTAEKITGYHRKDMPTLDAWFSLLYGKQGPRVRQLYEADRENGYKRITTSPTTIRRKDGSERQVQFSVYRIDHQHEVWLMQDITERQLAQRTLRRLATVVADSYAAITVLDFDGNIKAWNTGAINLYGYTEPEAVSMNIADIVPDNKKPEIPLLLKNISQGKIIKPFETQRVTKSGKLLDVNLTITLLTDDEGKPDAIATTEQDVTDSKQVENALRENEQRLCAIMDNAAEGIIVFKHDGTITDFNLAAEKLFNYQAKELIGLNISHLMPSTRERKNRAYLESRLQTDKKWVFNQPRGLNTQRKDHTILPVEMILAEIDHLDLICCITRDLSKQKALERQIADISSKEQERIGRDIHDGLGQQLTGLSMMTARLKKDLAKKNIPEAEELEEISKHLQQAIEDARNLSHGLVPVPIGPDSLATALRKLAKDVQSLTGIACHFESQQSDETLDHLKEMEYFRLAQEAVNNAVKHGKPENISIELNTTDKSTSLIVRDDGTGFLPNEVSDQCYGLRIMRYRAGIIGCDLDISSSPGAGTVVACKEV